MKKYVVAVFVAVMAALTMTSCWDDPVDEYEIVRPGWVMYDNVKRQNELSMIPVDFAIRLNMLLTDAKAEGETDLDNVEITVGKQTVNVKEALFSVYHAYYGEKLFYYDPKIAHDGAGKYTMTFEKKNDSNLKEYSINNLDGVITVDTKGLLLEELGEEDVWEIAVEEDFTCYTAAFYDAFFKAGSYEISKGDADDTWDIVVTGSEIEQTSFYEVTTTSDWNCNYVFSMVDAEALALSGIAEAEFRLEGEAHGVVIVGVAMDYVIEETLEYLPTGLLVNGKITVGSDELHENNPGVYPRRNAEVEWVRAGSSSYVYVAYNGDKKRVF